MFATVANRDSKPLRKRAECPSRTGGTPVSPLRLLLLCATLLCGGAAQLWAAPSDGTPSLALRARVEPSASRYYVGQRVRLVLEVEARGAEIAQIQQLPGLPAPEWAQKLDEAELKGERGVRDGETSHVWRYAIDYLLVAPGTQGFQPRVRTMLATRSQRGNGPAFVFSSSIERPAAASADAISLEVVSPPSPAPADFCGLVGDFRLETSLVPAEASPGDLVNLRWSLIGLGNFADFHPPAVEAPADLFRAYAPKIETPAEAHDRVDVAQVFVPQTLAATNLPPLAVTVFDPIAGTYRTLRTGPFALGLSERVAEDETEYLPSPAPDSKPDAQASVGSSLSETAAVPGASSVLAAPAIGRLAPSASSVKLRTLPAGTAVEVLERSGAWARVVAPGGPSVWIPASAAGEKAP